MNHSKLLSDSSVSDSSISQEDVIDEAIKLGEMKNSDLNWQEEKRFLLQEIDSMEDKIKQLQKKNIQIENRYKNEINAYVKKIQELESKLSLNKVFENDYENTKNELKEANIMMESLKTECEKLSKSTDMGDELQNTKKDLKTLSDNYYNALSQLVKIENENTKLKEELNILRTQKTLNHGDSKLNSTSDHDNKVQKISDERELLQRKSTITDNNLAKVVDMQDQKYKTLSVLTSYLLLHTIKESYT